MTMHFSSYPQDGPDIVHSHRSGHYYTVTDLTSVDSQIAYLRDQVKHNDNLTDYVKAQYQRDIDRLLDRRLFLEAMGKGMAA